MRDLILKLQFEVKKLNKLDKNVLVHNLKNNQKNLFFKFISELFCNSESLNITDKKTTNANNAIKCMQKYIPTDNLNLINIKNHYEPNNIENVDDNKVLRTAITSIFGNNGIDNVYYIILYFMFFYNVIDDIYKKAKFDINNNKIEGYKVFDLNYLFIKYDITSLNLIDKINDINNDFIDNINEDPFSKFMYKMGYNTVISDNHKKSRYGGVVSHVNSMMAKSNATNILGKRSRSENRDSLYVTTSNKLNVTNISSDKTKTGYFVQYVFRKKENILDENIKDFLNKILKNIVESIKIEKEEIEKEIVVKYIDEDDTTNNLNICEYKDNKLPFAPIKFIKNNKKAEWYLKGYYNVTHTNLKFNNKENINLDIKPIDKSDVFQIVSYNLNNNSSLTDNIFINNCNNLNSNVFNFVCLQECNHIIKNKIIINKLKLKLSTNFRNINTNIYELIEDGNILNKIIEKDGRNYYLIVRDYNTDYYVIIIPDKLQEINHNIKYIAILIRKDTDLNNYNAIISLLDDTKQNKRRRICLGLKETRNTNNRCIINVHFSANIQFKLQYSELSYLLNKIIKKEHFFRESDKKKFINEIMIIGDFNLDAYEIADEILNSEIIRKKYKTTILFNNIITRGSLCTNDKNKETKYAGQNLDNIVLLNKSTFYTNSEVSVGYNNMSFKDCKSIKKDVNNISDHSPIYSCLKTSESLIQQQTTNIKSSENVTFKYKELKNMEENKLLKIIAKLIEKNKLDKDKVCSLLECT